MNAPTPISQTFDVNIDLLACEPSITIDTIDPAGYTYEVLDPYLDIELAVTLNPACAYSYVYAISWQTGTYGTLQDVDSSKVYRVETRELSDIGVHTPNIEVTLENGNHPYNVNPATS